MSKIIVMGDVHAGFGAFNTFVNKKRPEILLQTGDFGYWPRCPDVYAYPKVPEGTIVHWCDGNHEDHQELRMRQTDELWPRVYYQPRGSTIMLPDGRTVLFMGGALSIDRDLRIQGSGVGGWFPEEQPNFAELHALDENMHVDIVISHTCPLEFDISIDTDPAKYAESTRSVLSCILSAYHPKLWYFGHWHAYQTGQYNGCKWTCLNRFMPPPNTNSWVVLPA